MSEYGSSVGRIEADLSLHNPRFFSHAPSPSSGYRNNQTRSTAVQSCLCFAHQGAAPCFLNRSHPPGFSYCLFPASEASSATASHSAVGQNGSACCSSFAPQPPIQQHEKLLLIPKGTKANIKESHKGVIHCPPAKEGGPFSSQPAACAHLQHSPMGISSGAFAGHRIHTPVARKKSRR